MSPARQLVASWDTCEIAQAQAEYLREDDPDLSEDEAFARACADADLLDFEWRHVVDCLTDVLREIAPDGHFHAEGRNMGWQRRRGYKDFRADDGQSFLRELLPDTDCTFTIEREGATLHIRNAHHDAPCGEFYTVVPAPEKDGAP
jgi:hypothetical protein